MKHQFALVTSILVMAVSHLTAVPAQAKSPEKDKNIVETAVVAGNFRTLTQLLQVAGLASTLEGAGPFTVLAPSDKAFSKLPPGTIESLSKPENREKLVEILTYHVVPGRKTAREIKAGKLKTLNGKELMVTVDKGVIKFNGAGVVKPDIKTRNGIIHEVDTVILP